MVSAFGIGITIKAAIGVSSFNAMNIAFANAFDIKVGTITMAINVLFLYIYIYMTRFKLKKKYLLQFFSVVLFGFFINFFTYTILGGWVIERYLVRVIALIVGTLIGGSAVGMIVSLNAITFPIESVCLLLSEKTRYSFTQLRYAVDVFSVAVSLSISFVFVLPLYVREGTLLSLMLFSFTMGEVKKRYSRHLL
ncbi:Uncharacterized membrane protein YczE [Anoxynatronum buryatiense]|uniref:Uncharacterized membrane protein YczE n=2 Tax=Anoxynatronum buryatiense TaxID=489973 RepID=A0AA45WWM7_9CLOT|nr:Uncharacterized membrane protein YczE [Anoxynatronum buryatiense]